MFHRMYRSILSALLLLSVLQGQAQRYFFENVAALDGLPASKVDALLQDIASRDWIGTESGLAR